MKNKLLIGLSVLFFAATSCDTKESDVNVYKGDTDLTYFTDQDGLEDTRTLVLTESGSKSTVVTVGSTVKTDADRTFTVSVDPASTALEGTHFDFTSNTITIPAGEYVGTTTINFDYLSLPEGGVQLILVLAGENINPTDNVLIINATTFCESLLAGTHDYVTSNVVAGDGGGSCPSSSGTVTWTQVSEGEYSTSDMTFGMYPSCYGVAPAVLPRFVHVCSEITALPVPDQYGDTYTYTIVSVDGPVMVIDWNNTYGDGGTATITRENGADWQTELQTN